MAPRLRPIGLVRATFHLAEEIPLGSGHTLLTLGAFVLLSTILVNFYGTSASAGDAIGSGQDGIFLTSITTSFIEQAQGLAFDSITDTMHVGLSDITSLTSPLSLGPEAGEDSLQAFNDFDDLNGFSIEREAGTSNRRYRAEFVVSYVDMTDLEKVLMSRTFIKRLDIKTWRTFPVSRESGVDTLRTSFVMGYFHFD
jgi:hypothetical protein